RLDEVLLAHHRRLALEHRVAVLRGVLEGIAIKRVALAEALDAVEAGVHGAEGARRAAADHALEVPAARTAGALDCDQPPVPAARRRAPTGRRIVGGIEQHGALVDAAVDD